MARRTKEDANETKQNIIDAAVKVFMKKGVGSATLEDIAKEAGVTRGAIYWHFRDKSAIVNEIVNVTMTPIAQMVNAITKNHNPDSLEELKSHIKNIFKEVFNNKKTKNIFCVILTKLSYSDDMKEFFKAEFERSKEMSDMMDNFFKGLQEKGVIKKNFHYHTIAYGIYCYVLGLMTEYFKNPLESDLEKEYSSYVDLFFSRF